MAIPPPENCHMRRLCPRRFRHAIKSACALLPDTPIVIAPHPLVQRSKQSIQRRRSGASRHRQLLHLT